MARFTPTPMEISAIEQIETAIQDTTLEKDYKESLVRKLWAALDKAHGCRVLSIITPEGVEIPSPFENN